MITDISASVSSATGAAAMKKATGMNKDDFLKMFVAQLQNQDPLNPQDGTEFLAQLSQLTQVEQAYNTNTNLQNLLTAQSNMMVVSAVSFIGKEVTTEGSRFQVAPGDQPVLNYKLSQPVEEVSVQVKDGAGNVVRTLTGGAAALGQHTMAWDGKDANNVAVPAGTYTFTVNGLANGQQVAGTPLVKGVVDGVRLDGASPILTVSGSDVQLSSVLQVKGA